MSFHTKRFSAANLCRLRQIVQVAARRVIWLQFASVCSANRIRYSRLKKCIVVYLRGGETFLGIVWDRLKCFLCHKSPRDVPIKKRIESPRNESFLWLMQVDLVPSLIDSSYDNLIATTLTSASWLEEEDKLCPGGNALAQRHYSKSQYNLAVSILKWDGWVTY